MSEPTAAEEKAHAAMRAQVGKPIGPIGVAPDPVNQPMIRHWAAAFEDANPVYVDPEFAAKTRFGGIVAPPLMLQTWSMPTPKLTGALAKATVVQVPIASASLMSTNLPSL